MSDDLKERLRRSLRTKLVSDLDETRDALSRIEQLEAEKAELHLIYHKHFERAKALEVLHGNEVNRSMELEAQLAEEKAKHALTIQQSDHFSAQLDTAADLAKDRNLQLADLQTQLAKANSALEEEAANAGRAWSALESVKAQLAAAREALEPYRNALLWAFERLSGTGGMNADEQRRTMREIGKVLSGQPSTASKFKLEAIATSPATDGGSGENHG